MHVKRIVETGIRCTRGWISEIDEVYIGILQRATGNRRGKRATSVL